MPEQRRATSSRARTGNATRRAHRKSRNGCKQCKERHRKCDEHHPVCVNCSTANQQCSFSSQPSSSIATPSVTNSPALSPLSWRSRSPGPAVTNSTRTPTTSGYETTSPATTTPSMPTLSTAPSSAATPCLPSFVPSYIRPDDNNSPSFSLNHLALMHHLERAKFAMLVGNEAEVTAFFDFMFRTAYDVPYLMDEFLAFSALHLSTLHNDPAVNARYRQQAAELQTRALTQFNSMDPEIRNAKVLAMFIFSSMLGLHILFDTGVSFNGDLGDFLDSFVRYLTLHRGVQAVVRSNWELIRSTEIQLLITPMMHYDRTHVPPEGLRAERACAKLKDLVQGLSKNGGSTSLVETCLEGIKALEWVLERQSVLDSRYKAQAVSAWPIMLEAEFIELLKQRRPEALAILAHWAVVLHLNRQFWVFGDTGRILILAVTKHLGSYWDEWLAWPKEVLRDG